MSEEEKELPRGWAKTNFSNVCLTLSDKGKKLKQKQYLSTGKYPVIDQGDSDIAGFTDDETLVFDGQFPIVAFGDHTRRFKKISKKFVVGADGVKLFKPSSHLNFDYILYLLRISKFEDRGYSRHFQFVKKLNLSIAPLAEQTRIVDKIDELFSSIEAGERAIARARTALTRYRKAVLKAAVSGELTKEWRAENPPTETADTLLTRILKARYAAWEKAELEKLDVKSKARPETKKQWEKFRARYKAPVEPDTDELPSLPQGWVWTTQDMLLSDLITGPFGSMLHQSDYVETGTPLVNPISIVQGKIIETKLKYLDDETIKRLERFKLIEGDVVIARRGDMGRCASVLNKHNGWLCGTGSMILRPNELVLTEYLSQSLQYGHALAYLNSNAIGTTMKNLNRTILKLVPIAICSIEEQFETLSKIEEALSKADKVETTLDAQARQAKALKQAVLKFAFEGNLVPQNPKDEPASELLKRIKEET